MKYLVGLIVIAAVAAGVFIFTGRDDKGSTGTNQQTQTTTPPASTTPPSNNSQAQSTSDKVSISNFAFSPTDITVKKGTTVTWTNNDSVAHTINFDTDDITDSGNLGNDQTFSVTFSDEGTFNYTCGIHSSMHGTVTVSE